MAATVEIRSYHGSSPDSGTNIAAGSLRFKQADNDTADANNPIPVPAAGTNYSFVKQLRFYAATTPSNTINALKFYTDGSNTFGTSTALRSKTEASYTDPIALGAADLTGTADAFAATSGSPLSITGTLSNPTTGAFGDYIKLQFTVGTTGVQGTTTGETLTFQYDES